MRQGGRSYQLHCFDSLHQGFWQSLLHISIALAISGNWLSGFKGFPQYRVRMEFRTLSGTVALLSPDTVGPVLDEPAVPEPEEGMLP